MAGERLLEPGLREGRWQAALRRLRHDALPAAAGWYGRREHGARWFTRTPDQVAAIARDAIGWVRAHPPMHVGAPATPPLVLLEAWNELGEGGYVLATKQDGYAYGRALADAVGTPWSTVHARSVTAGAAAGVLTGKVRVLDDWTPCDVTSV